MKDINSVVQVGRLTRDPELKYTQGGMAIMKGSIAVNRLVKDGDGWKDEASFFEFTLFGKQAEAVHKYCEKGKQIAIRGELKQDRWEQDGQKRSKVVIIADSLQLLGGKSDGSRPQTGGSTHGTGEGFEGPEELLPT
jgi:single-strand DNA-binding protein